MNFLQIPVVLCNKTLSAANFVDSLSRVFVLFSRDVNIHSHCFGVPSTCLASVI